MHVFLSSVFFLCVCAGMCACVCWHVCVCVCLLLCVHACVCLHSLILHPETEENNVDGGGDLSPSGPIPEISITGVGGERVGVANGEALRSRSEGEALGCTTEVGVDPRGQPEVRRQKSVRRHMEDGATPSGRVHF